MLRAHVEHDVPGGTFRRAHFSRKSKPLGNIGPVVHFIVGLIGIVKQGECRN